MGKHVKLGDRLEVVFAPARYGAQTQELINGRRAFATESGPTPVTGDRWEVMVVGMNPSRTVYFVEPLNFVDAADGLGEMLKPHAVYFHEYIRECEAEFEALLSMLGSGEAYYNPEAMDDEVTDILSAWPLPDSYKTVARSRFRERLSMVAQPFEALVA